MKRRIAELGRQTSRLALCLAGLGFGFSALATDAPIGWAAVNALGQNGTTGGGNGALQLLPLGSLTNHPTRFIRAVAP